MVPDFTTLSELLTQQNSPSGLSNMEREGWTQDGKEVVFLKILELSI